MMTRMQFWLTTALGIACLLLVSINIVLVRDNQATRNDISLRQQYVQQSVQLEGLYREIVRSLAELAARNKDADVTAMLQRHGISFNVAPAGAAGAAGGAAPNGGAALPSASPGSSASASSSPQRR